MSESKLSHAVEVVEVNLEKHPNADRLSIVRMFDGGYLCVTGTEDWLKLPPINDRGARLGAWIQPDSTVDVTRPEFEFLAKDATADGRARIKVRKIRDIVSYGMLVPAPAGSKVGDDVAAQLGVLHWNPPTKFEQAESNKFHIGGTEAEAPGVRSPDYDLENFRRLHRLFVSGERVVVTEKVDGTSARFTWVDGKQHCGGHYAWKKEFPDYSHLTVEAMVAGGCEEEKAKATIERLNAKVQPRNAFWDILDKTPGLAKFCRDNPGVVVYGEVAGTVNILKYLFPDGNRFFAFDVMRDGRWVDANEARDMLEAAKVPCVPLMSSSKSFDLNGNGIHDFSTHPYDFDAMCALAEGPTTTPDSVAGLMREGVVVKPVKERRDPHYGRVCLKIISEAFSQKHRK